MNTATAECEEDDGAKPWCVRATFTSDGSADIWADRAVAVGEELLLTYGPLSSAELWAAYGFLPANENVFEGADLVVDIREALAASPPSLRLAQEEALQSFLNWNGSSRLTLQLRSGVVGDAHAGGLLLPVARLLALPNDADVAAIAPRVFWMCPGGAGQPSSLGLRLEVQARRLLQRWLHAAMAVGDAAAARLDGGATQAPAALRELAARLLAAERRLLAAEHTAAEEVCEAFDAATDVGEAALEELAGEIWDAETGFYGAG